MYSAKKVARIAGALNLIIAVCAPFSIIYIPSKLIVSGDAATTAGNIMANEMLFRLGVVSSLAVHIIQIMFVVLLYQLFKSYNKNGALFMLVLSLIGVSIALLNEVNQLAVLLLLSGAPYLQTFNTAQLYTQSMFFLNLHNNGVLIAQIFWGLWLFPLGYLIFKSGYVSRIIGILLVVAGLGYLIDCFGKLLSPGYNISVSSFTFIGELIFTLWLLIKGVRQQETI